LGLVLKKKEKAMIKIIYMILALALTGTASWLLMPSGAVVDCKDAPCDVNILKFCEVVK